MAVTRGVVLPSLAILKRRLPSEDCLGAHLFYDTATGKIKGDSLASEHRHTRRNARSATNSSPNTNRKKGKDSKNWKRQAWSIGTLSSRAPSGGVPATCLEFLQSIPRRKEQGDLAHQARRRKKNGKKRSFTFHIGVCQKILALDRCAACLLSGAPPALRFVADCQLDRSHHGWCNL